MAAGRWRGNSALIADAARLYFPEAGGRWAPPNPRVLDPTFGKGNFWRAHRPANLTAHDVKLDGVSYLDAPYPGGPYDVVVFDPPYVAPGGRRTSTIPEFNAAYGIDVCAATPQGLFEECLRGAFVLADALTTRGLLFVKTKDYVSSGRFFDQTTAWCVALADRFELLDRFELVGAPGPQEAGRRQVHARRNLSTLLAFRQRRR